MTRVLALGACLGLAAAGCHVTREPERLNDGEAVRGASSVDEGEGVQDVDAGSASEAAGCRSGSASVIRGDVYITEQRRPLTDLIGVQEVTGTLHIAGTMSEQLEELSCLRSVGGLHIGGNDALVGLDGLAQLRYIAGDLHLSNNRELRNLRGLGSVRGTIGLLPLGRCPLDRHFERYLCVEPALLIERNAALESLAGLEGIEEVTGYAEISENAALESLAGLDGLRVVDELTLSRNSVLTDVALPSLESAGTLLVAKHPILEVLGPLDRLVYVDHLHVIDNPELTSIDLPAIEGVGSLLVRENDRLHSLSGLDTLREITLGLAVSSNASLETLAALGNVRGPVGSIPGWLLERAFDSVSIQTQWQVAGISIANNPALRSLAGLEGITAVDGGLHILRNERLIDLRGLDGLVRVGDSIGFDSNAALESLEGLHALEHVAGDVWITYNPSLTDVAALAGVVHDGHFHVEANPQLAETALDALGPTSAPDAN